MFCFQTTSNFRAFGRDKRPSARSLAVFIALFVLSTMSHAEFLDVAECQSFLKEPAPESPQALARAAELLSWVQMKHPVVAALMSRRNSVKTMYEMLFVTNGFVLPPTRATIWTSNTQSVRHWNGTTDIWTQNGDRWAARSYWSKKALSDVYGLVDRPEAGEKVEFVSSLLCQAMSALAKVTSPSSNFGTAYESAEVELRFHLNLPKVHWRISTAIATLVWPHSLRNEELKGLHSAWESSSDLEVRSALVHLTFLNLGALITNHRTLCERLGHCASANEFDGIYREVIKPEVRSEIEKPRVQKAIAAARLPKLVPPKYDSHEIDRFVATTSSSETLERDHENSREAARLLNDAIFALRGWSEDRVDWSVLESNLRPDMPAVDLLRRTLAEIEDALMQSQAEFEKVALAIGKLEEWIGATRRRVDPRIPAEDQLSRMGASERRVIDGLVRMLPNLDELARSAREAVEGRRETMLGQELDIATVTLLIGRVGQQFLLESNSEQSVAGYSGYQLLAEALATLSAEMPK